VRQQGVCALGLKSKGALWQLVGSEKGQESLVVAVDNARIPTLKAPGLCPWNGRELVPKRNGERNIDPKAAMIARDGITKS
jgi:hypothetical protein